MCVDRLLPRLKAFNSYRARALFSHSQNENHKKKRGENNAQEE